MKTIVTKNSDETKELAKQLGKSLKTPHIIALYGSLGSGKTTFIQGLAKSLGIEKRVLSPTFVFIRQYELARDNKFYHVDLYRLDSGKDVDAIGLAEILEDKDALVAIEWPEKIEKFLPKNTMKIKFKTVDDEKRKIEFLDSFHQVVGG